MSLVKFDILLCGLIPQLICVLLSALTSEVSVFFTH